jgi:two-component system, OmpR family, response regulator TctD
MHALLVDNDASLAQLLIAELAKESIALDWVRDGEVAQQALSEAVFDAVLLNWELPRRTGLEVLAHVRAAHNQVPIVMSSESDVLGKRLQSLNAGADDFLAKPFALAELKARLHAVVRRSAHSAKSELRYGSLVFDSDTRSFQIDGAYLMLTPREGSMLAALIDKAGSVVSRQMLGQLVFCEDLNRERVEVVIHRLRKKLMRSAVNIETIRGTGYRLIAKTIGACSPANQPKPDDDDVRHQL